MSQRRACSTQQAIRDADGFLAAALREDALPPLTRPDLLPGRALYHGVSALLAAKAEVMGALPPAIQASIRHQALAETMWDLRHRQVLVGLLAAMAEAGVGSVILKGTALAYGRYDSPSLRPRGDTDLLVPLDKAATIYCILEAQGFTRSLDSNSGVPTTVIRQEAWSCHLDDGSEHAIDLHWGVMNAWSLAHLFDTAEVFRQSQPLPALAPTARMMGNLHTVYHACLHRAVHIRSPYHVGGDPFHGGDRLIWLYDLHLMLPHLTKKDSAALVDLCRAHQTADLCLNALTEAHRLLGTSVPDDLLAGLEGCGIGGRAMAYLAHDSELKRHLADLAAMPGFAARAIYIRMLLFPSPYYIRAKYPDMANRAVWLLYLRRLATALRRKWWAGPK